MSSLVIDVNSPTWQALNERANEMIEASRTKLENPLLSPSETDVERGKIKALRDLFAVEQPRQPSISTDAAGY